LRGKTKLTFYGGVNEIGGNKILLEDKDTRIFLDFGKSFTARSAFYDWTEKPRLANGIGDFLSLGILPDLTGIYRDDLLILSGRVKKEERFVDGVLLSHAHADHADYVSLLREDIPIWMGETAKHIINALEAERKANIEFEISRFKKRPIERGADPVERKIHTFKTTPRGKIKIGSIEIEPVHVDHSIPGCYGFIIRTSNSTLVYSGDLRMHGNKPELTAEFVERASRSKPDLMLCEGTRITETSSSKESDVLATSKYYIERAKDLFVFADYSYKDIDRLATFYSVAKFTNRKLLIDTGYSRYLHALSVNTSLNLPKLDDENIAIYKPRQESGTYDDEDYDKEDLEFYEQHNVMTAEDVRKNQSGVIAALGSGYVQELIDIRPSGGLYFHSMSEPFNEEGEIGEEKMNHWIERFGMSKVHSHCSGHASGKDLNEIITTIGPKTIVPIHTEHPESFNVLQSGKVKMVGLNDALEF
jgi:ribonuclease J